MASFTRCDRCHAECPPLQHARVEWHDYASIRFDGYPAQDKKDLCMQCFEYLKHWLNERTAS